MRDPWGAFGQVIRWGNIRWWIPMLLSWYGVLGLRAKRGPARQLPSTYHLAYLVDGPVRVVDTVVASMIERVQLRVDSAGKLYPTPTKPVHPLEQEVTALVMTPGSDTAFGLREPLRRSVPMAALVADLTAHGQVVSERARRRIWCSGAAVYFALVLLYVARLITDVEAGVQPGFIELLVCVMLLCTIVTAILTRPAKRAKTTKAGAASAQATGRDLSLGTSSTLTVALGGLAFYPDRALTETLVLPRLTADGS